MEEDWFGEGTVSKETKIRGLSHPVYLKTTPFYKGTKEIEEQLSPGQSYDPTVRCSHCEEPILPHTQIIKRYYFRYYKKSGKRYWYYRYYHFQCWKEVERKTVELNITRMEEWFSQHRPGEKQGSRRKAIPGMERKRNSLVSLLIYHRKRNHQERVKDLEQEIKTLEPYNTGT